MELILTIFTILGLTFIAGYCNGCMDWIKKFNLDKNSWLNKWELDENGNVKPRWHFWYYFGLFKPEHEERFPYSSTILVFLTDAWHGKKWKMFLCYEIIISSCIVYYEHLPWYITLIGVILLKIVRGLGFTLKYDKK